MITVLETGPADRCSAESRSQHTPEDQEGIVNPAIEETHQPP